MVPLVRFFFFLNRLVRLHFFFITHLTQFVIMRVSPCVGYNCINVNNIIFSNYKFCAHHWNRGEKSSIELSVISNTDRWIRVFLRTEIFFYSFFDMVSILGRSLILNFNVHNFFCLSGKKNLLLGFNIMKRRNKVTWYAILFSYKIMI